VQCTGTKENLFIYKEPVGWYTFSETQFYGQHYGFSKIKKESGPKKEYIFERSHEFNEVKLEKPREI
jgi:hypothetical protein